MRNIATKFADWVIYQIYPRSFADSNGDGIGDLKGITQKLDHLAELGINAVWLSPCYKSPNDDNGYDISDYRNIMDEFGTLDDFKVMIAEMHRRGIRLIMDLVPNHTSTAHEWFEKSRNRVEPYTDYYHWFDQPQNDWCACFGGSAWQWDDVRNQYYLHSYAVSQADLNFDNPLVRKEMCNVIDFWVNLGVDGFRIDVIDQISKDMKGNNGFGPNLHNYINEMFGRKDVDFLFTVGECWASDIEEIKRHCADGRNELKTLFQFEHIDLGRNGGRFFPVHCPLENIFKVISKWEKLYVENNLLYSLFTDNHDQPRFISRFSNDKELRYECATMFATAFYLLKGVPFIYQGQEIGVRNSQYLTFNHFADIENVWFCDQYLPTLGESGVCEVLSKGSRDNARRPMPWNSGDYGGFSCVEPWLSANSDIDEINVERDKQQEKSVFAYYKQLLALRKNSQTVLLGTYKEISTSGAFVYERELNGEKILVVCNYDRPNKIQLPSGNLQLLLTNHNKTQLDEQFAPYEVRVYYCKE